MKDKEFLEWLHERLASVFAVSTSMDYMHRLRTIINNTNPEQNSSLVCASGNSIKEKNQPQG